jgi:hypothetical protein
MVEKAKSPKARARPLIPTVTHSISGGYDLVNLQEVGRVARLSLHYAFGLAFLAAACPALAVTQPDPPRDGCVAVARQEYEAAKKKDLLRTRNGEYVRTGSLIRRAYWYCR